MGTEGRKRVQPEATSTAHAAMVLSAARTMAAVAAYSNSGPGRLPSIWHMKAIPHSCAVDDLICL